MMMRHAKKPQSTSTHEFAHVKRPCGSLAIVLLSQNSSVLLNFITLFVLGEHGEGCVGDSRKPVLGLARQSYFAYLLVRDNML